MEDPESDARLAIISHYRLMSAGHFGIGFFMVFFATYTAMKVHGEGTGKPPYYIGPFIAFVGIMPVCLFGVEIYYKGHMKKDVTRMLKRLMKTHYALAVFAVVCCVIGALFTMVTGFCSSDLYSYNTETTFNLGMAVFLFFLELFCLLSAVLTIVHYSYSRKYFTKKHIFGHKIFSHSNTSSTKCSVKLEGLNNKAKGEENTETEPGLVSNIVSSLNQCPGR